MKPGKNPYLTIAHKYWRTVANKEAIIDNEQLQTQIDAHKKLLSIFQPGNYYYLLFDIYNAEIVQVSDEVSGVLGYEANEMDMRLFMESIHPEDKLYFLNFETSVTLFFKSVSYKDYKDYKIQYDLRIKTKKNDYSRILIQYVLISYEEHSIYNSFHIHTDITHIKPQGYPCFSVIGMDGKPSFYNIQDTHFKKSLSLFTRREREILKGIVEGKTSKILADELCISIHTLHTHRKNILGKANTKTPVDLVRKAICEGWV